MIGDIDLLVEEKYIFKAKQILIENGFKNIHMKKLLNNENNFLKHLNRMTNPILSVLLNFTDFALMTQIKTY